MLFRTLALLIALLLVVASPATAQTRTEKIIAGLRGMNFTHIEVGRTWLGRTRIRAFGPEGKREIVLNPKTEEVLRDIWRPNVPAQDGTSSREGLRDWSSKSKTSGSPDPQDDNSPTGSGASVEDGADDDGGDDSRDTDSGDDGHDDDHDDGGDDHDDGGDDD